MASFVEKGKSDIYIQYTYFRHGDGIKDDITVISFKNSDDFSDERKEEISEWIKKLVEENADVFLTSSKYNVGISIRGENNMTQFLISEGSNS